MTFPFVLGPDFICMALSVGTFPRHVTPLQGRKMTKIFHPGEKLTASTVAFFFIEPSSCLKKFSLFYPTFMVSYSNNLEVLGEWGDFKNYNLKIIVVIDWQHWLHSEKYGQDYEKYFF